MGHTHFHSKQTPASEQRSTLHTAMRTAAIAPLFAGLLLLLASGVESRGNLRGSSSRKNKQQQEPERRQLQEKVDCSTNSEWRQQNGCVEAVIVMRHAEDVDSGPPALTAAGQHHAQLYPALIDEYIHTSHGAGSNGAEVCFCPVGAIHAIDPNPNSINPYPSSNPYNTAVPTAQALGLSINVEDPQGVHYTPTYDWNQSHVDSLVSAATGSKLIFWDRQGLNWTKPSDITATPALGDHPGLLERFSPSSYDAGYSPSRQDFFVFNNRSDDGSFERRWYTQQYSHDGTNWYSPGGRLTDGDFPVFIRTTKV